MGHVSRFHYTVKDTPLCYCGWNLDPDYWGLGIMRTALADLFDELFGSQAIAHVFADCFRNNHRCIRLMNKLNFLPVPILWRHRMIDAWRNRCLRWVLRFQLDRTAWLYLTETKPPATEPPVMWL